MAWNLVFNTSKNFQLPSKQNRKSLFQCKCPIIFQKTLTGFSIGTNIRKVLSCFLNAYSKWKAESLILIWIIKHNTVCPGLEISNLYLFAFFLEICTDEAKAMVSKMLAPYQEYKVVAPKGTSNNYIHYYK